MKKLIKIIIYIAMVLVFQELVLRLCFPLPEVLNFNRSNYIPKPDNIEKIDPMRYEQKTFQSYPDTTANFVHFLNGYGFRDTEWKIEKPLGKKRILFIGDSFLEGAMVSQNKTITEAFKRQSIASDYEVFNMGIIGAGLREYAKLIHDAVPLFKPDYLFLILFSNDISNRRVDIPIAANKYLKKKFKPRLFELAHLIVQNEPLPFRWKKSTSFIPAVPNPLNLWTDNEEKYKPHVTSEFAELMKMGNLNTFRINYAAAEEKYLKDTVNMFPYLKWVSNYAKKNDSQLIVSYIPSRHQVTNFYYPFELPTCQQLCPKEGMDLTSPEYQIHRKMLSETCENLKIPFFDLTEDVKNEESLNNHLYWNYDDHMRAKGYALIGEKLFKSWEKLPN